MGKWKILIRNPSLSLKDIKEGFVWLFGNRNFGSIPDWSLLSQRSVPWESRITRRTCYQRRVISDKVINSHVNSNISIWEDFGEKMKKKDWNDGQTADSLKIVSFHGDGWMVQMDEKAFFRSARFWQEHVLKRTKAFSGVSEIRYFTRWRGISSE